MPRTSVPTTSSTPGRSPSPAGRSNGCGRWNGMSPESIRATPTPTPSDSHKRPSVMNSVRSHKRVPFPQVRGLLSPGHGTGLVGAKVVLCAPGLVARDAVLTITPTSSTAGSTSERAPGRRLRGIRQYDRPLGTPDRAACQHDTGRTTPWLASRYVRGPVLDQVLARSARCHRSTAPGGRLRRRDAVHPAGNRWPNPPRQGSGHRRRYSRQAAKPAPSQAVSSPRGGHLLLLAGCCEQRPGWDREAVTRSGSCR